MSFSILEDELVHIFKFLSGKEVANVFQMSKRVYANADRALPFKLNFKFQRERPPLKLTHKGRVLYSCRVPKTLRTVYIKDTKIREMYKHKLPKAPWSEIEGLEIDTTPREFCWTSFGLMGHMFGGDHPEDLDDCTHDICVGGKHLIDADGEAQMSNKTEFNVVTSSEKNGIKIVNYDDICYGKYNQTWIFLKEGQTVRCSYGSGEDCSLCLNVGNRNTALVPDEDIGTFKVMRGPEPCLWDCLADPRLGMYSPLVWWHKVRKSVSHTWNDIYYDDGDDDADEDDENIVPSEDDGTAI